METCTADISDLEAITPAFDGVDTVIHMAAHSGEASFEEILRHNIIGTYNVFEAARRAGCRRIVAASSGATVSNWEKEMPYSAIVEGRYEEAPDVWDKLTHDTPVRPTGLYGCSKVWLEAAGRQMTDTSELSVICLRIGRVLEEDRPLEPRHFAVWCSRRDLSQMVERCIEAPASLKFDIFYAVSANRWGIRDLSHARRQVGYEPLDSAESFRTDGSDDGQLASG